MALLRNNMVQTRMRNVDYEWEHAKHLAMIGRINEIELHVQQKYYVGLKLISTRYGPKLDPLTTLDNEWYVISSCVDVFNVVQQQYYGAFYLNNNCWDDYKGQEVVVVYYDGRSRSSRVSLIDLRQWGDYYAFRIQITKKGFITIRPKKIIVISSKRIEEFCDTPSDLKAMQVRFKEILYSE